MRSSEFALWMATAAAPASTALRERDRLIFGQRRKEREVQKGTKLAVSSFQRRCIGPAFRGLSLVCGTDIQVLSNRSPSSGHINLRAIAGWSATGASTMGKAPGSKNWSVGTKLTTAKDPRS